MGTNEQDFYCDQVLKGLVDIHTIEETEYTLAYYHTMPFYEVHAVVIPKRHIRSLMEVTPGEEKDLMEVIHTIKRVCEIFNRKYGACTVSTNIGDYQSNKHLHWHVHFGKRVRDEHGNIINIK